MKSRSSAKAAAKLAAESAAEFLNLAARAVADLVVNCPEGFLPVGKIKKSLPAKIRTQLTRRGGKIISADFWARILTANRGDKLRVIRDTRGARKARQIFIALDLADADLLLRFLRARSEITRREIAKVFPFAESGLNAALNCLIAAQKITVEFAAKQSVKILLSRRLRENAAENFAAPANPSVAHDLESAFKRAYDELERGKTFARICDLRRRLAWPREQFDAVLTALRDAEKLQLQTGDLEFFSADDIRQSFTDENGFQMLNVTWRA